MLGIADDAVGPDLDPLPQAHPADQDRIDVDEHVAAHLDLAAYIDARGSARVAPGEHQALRARSRRYRASTCASWILSLTPMTCQASRMRCASTRSPALHRARDHIGEIVLALRIVPPQAQQPFAQASGRSRHESRVDFANLRAASGLASLCSTMAADAAVGVADDAPIARRRRRDPRTARPARPAPARRDQFFKAASADQRHVAVQHQHRVIVRYDAHGLHDGMTGAELLRLQYPFDGLVRQGRLHLRAAMSVNHVDIGRAEARCAVRITCLQKRLPRQRLQHLR